MSTLEELIEELPTYITEASFTAYVKLVGIEYATIEGFEDAFEGEFDSDIEFAQTSAENQGIDISTASWPFDCIDWDHAAHTLMFDYMSEDGYYFRCL
jgi:antirestriction protein